jgi:rare lipoprotein A
VIECHRTPGLGGMNRYFVRQIAVRLTRAAALASAALALAQCSPLGAKYADGVGVRYADDDEQVSEITASTGRFTVGKPYSVRGRTYVPAEDPSYRADGIASWYGPDFHGGLTANGERYDMNGISAAHPTMPLPSYARVTNLDNGRSIIVRVNNRGPFVRNRLVDLSVGAARALDFYHHGTARVRVEYVGRAPREGGDDQMLLATLRERTPAPAPSKVMVAAAKPFLPKVRDEGRE